MAILTMAKFRKKPIIIEAIVWNGKNFDEISQFIGEDYGHKLSYEDTEEKAINTGEYFIKTLEGIMKANAGDYIIKGVNGEFYPCKPDIFEKTYEPVN